MKRSVIAAVAAGLGLAAIGGGVAAHLYLRPDPYTYFDSSIKHQGRLEYDAAILDATKAIEIDPHNSLLVSHRGQIYADMGKDDLALADLNAAVAMDARSADPLDDRADFYERRGKTGLALADYEKAAQLDPHSARTFDRRGSLHAQLGHFDQALADIDHAVALAGNVTDRAIYLNDRSEASSAKGDQDAAIAGAMKAIAAASKQDTLNVSWAHMRIAVAKRRKGDLAGAMDEASQGVQLAGFNVRARLELGLERFATGDMKGAAEQLREITSDAYYKKGAASALLFGYLANARSGEPADLQLADDAGNVRGDAWSTSLVDMYLGKETPEATLAAAAGPNETCEAHLHIGEWHLLKGKSANAAEAFKKAVATCARTKIEYTIADAELKRIKL